MYMETYKERLKSALNDRTTDYEVVRWIEQNFPELKESEDERIRKALIHFFSETENTSFEYWEGIPKSKVIAWLEEQGQHKKFRDSIQVGDKVTRNEDSVLVNLSQLKRVAKKDEKQGEQKSASFEIPLLEKFKQAVYDCAWGKVTCKTEGETQEEYAERWAEQLLSIVRDWADDYIDSREDTIRRGAYDKAIKEQKPAGWSKEDETNLTNIIIMLKEGASLHFNKKDIAKGVPWLKDLKARVQPKMEWSEDDSPYFDDICELLMNILHSESRNYNMEAIKKDLNWLKSLKDRVQPQNRWKPDKAVIQILELIIQGKANPTNYQATLMNLVEQLKNLGRNSYEVSEATI